MTTEKKTATPNTDTTPKRQCAEFKAVYSRVNLCGCGFPVLGNHIPLGTVYQHFGTMADGILICGGCKNEIKTKLLLVQRDGGDAGFVPSEIFDL